MKSKFKRIQFDFLTTRLGEKRKFIQILFGPRQVGKTTLMQQVLEAVRCVSVFVSADAQPQTAGFWISQQWDRARLLLRKQPESEVLLVFDEIQKIVDWSEYVKKEWDFDTQHRNNIKVVLLGSSALLMHKGITESLAGRFELIRIPHWSYEEMRSAFGISIDEYVYFGGYPGAAGLMLDEARWKQYIRDALVEPSLTKDVLLMTRIDKPALLRQVFQLGMMYSGRMVSYTKLLGQLQDAGNTTTIAHYLELLNTAGLLAGLQKFSMKAVKTRASSPKFQTYNMALAASLDAVDFKDVRKAPDLWGHYVESAVGAYLLNNAYQYGYGLTYWREGNFEVDFIISKNDRFIALEVTSGKKRELLSGMEKFNKLFEPAKSLLIGPGGIPLEDFFSMPIDMMFK